MELCLMKKINTLFFMLFYLFSLKATETFYYGPYPRDLEVNAKEETLLIFPSPPITQICQPSNTVQIIPVDSLTEMQALGLPDGTDYLNGDVSTNQGGVPPLANFLKLLPIQNEKTVCSIRLSNGDSISMKIIPVPHIQRPAIEFRPMKGGENFNQDFNMATNLFKQLISGGKLNSFKEISPGEDLAIKNTDKGNYKIEYLGTNSGFNAWIITAIFSKDIETVPNLKKVKLGEIYYSALLEKGVIKTVEKISKDKTYNLYILSRSDLFSKEIMEKLP